ncbi:MAG TPA: hypothetical protein VKZ63_18950 [Kofleriaceae bacterium]|nr:hypothetical protein [Kofleriaceae bacterium]
MKRTITTTFAAVAVLALAAAGCEKKDENKAGGASGAAGAAAAVPSKTGFAVFPADSKVIVGINVASARSSALWAKYKDQIEKATGGELAELKAACGIDPIAQAQTVIFGGNPNGPQGGDVVAVVKGFERSAMKSCGEKMAAKEGKQLAVVDEGNLSQYTVDGEVVWAAWLDDSTVVFAPNKDKAYVEARAKGEAGLTESAPIMALLKSVDTSAAIYLAADASVAGQGAAMAPGAQGMFASLRLTDGLAIDAGVRFDTADNAKNLTTMATTQLSQMKGSLPPPFNSIAEKAVIKQVDKDLVVQLSLTGAELEQVGQAVSGMAGGMLGGL